MKKRGNIILVVNIIFGVFLINLGFPIIPFTDNQREIISRYENWLFMITGILLLVGAWNQYRITGIKKKQKIAKEKN